MMKRVLAMVLVLGGNLAARSAEPVDFQRDIRPILSDNCFLCHGQDEGTRKGRLRLDSLEHALKGGRSGEPAFVAGKPGMSELVKRVAAGDAKGLMPPAKSGKKLTAAQIDLLRRWVAEGGKYETHWAFVKPTRPALPRLENPGWVRNPIDAFVLARLEREGLKPSPEASRETLLRRVYLDIVGLPPSPQEIDEYLKDESPDALKKVVDRLLARTGYGERWARHWLDAARYADSDGYEKDKPREVWMYRDWVVQAINRDLPYDQFIIEQLAGDLLPNPTQDQLVATGFLRNSMINEEGGIDPEQFRMEAMFDRMDAIGKSILGLTINCCQCHAHKYDPITQEDYYRLFAYLNDTYEANIATYTAEQSKKRADLFRQMRDIEDELKMKTPDWQNRMKKWEEQVRGNQPNWQVIAIKNAGDNAQRYIYHKDGSLTAWGYAPTKWTSQFTGKTDMKRITGIRLEMLTDPELPLGGPGRSPLGLFALSELTVEVANLKEPNKKTRVKFVSASADFGNTEKPLENIFDDKTGKKRVTGPVSYAIDGKDDTAWGIDAGPGRRNVSRKAVFVPEHPIDFQDGAELTIRLKQMHGGYNSDDNQNNNLGRFRFALTSAEAPKADPLPRHVRDIILKPTDSRTPAQNDAVFRYWMTTVPEWQNAKARIEELWQQHPGATSQLALMRRAVSRKTFLLSRGDFLRPERAVTPGVPSFLHALPKDARPDRLGLARWLVSKESPTTARSIVNRTWQAYFGTGLVSTSEDFGVQSPPPSHPELLDWLAVEFMDKGWSLKYLHRLITESATYRQSSHLNQELLKDPDNILLARGPRFRVEGEVVRDIALAASGLLTDKLGGPPVYPPAPDFLFKPPVSYGPKKWLEEHDADRYRRALYTFRFRSVPYPVLTNFDTPNGDASCVRRVRSNTPLQALTTLNEPLFLECARGLAQRSLNEGGKTDAGRITFAFRVCTGRQPSDAEMKVLASFLAKQTEKFSAKDAKPWELAANDPKKPPKLPEGVSPAQAAAWTALARLILNLDETITKE
ncbi:MAG: PSD1 and planctomycete cytochrome C domain-containing protein [Gemmataceae bacterium]